MRDNIIGHVYTAFQGIILGCIIMVFITGFHETQWMVMLVSFFVASVVSRSLSEIKRRF